MGRELKVEEVGSCLVILGVSIEALGWSIVSHPKSGLKLCPGSSLIEVMFTH